MRRLLPIALVCLSAWAFADTVFPRQGAAIEGKVVSETDTEVVVNPYFSKFPEVTWKIQRFAKGAVAKVVVTPVEPIREYWAREAAMKQSDAAGWAELAKFAKEKKLDVEAREAAISALAADPANADAKALLGADADKIFKSNPRLNPDLKARIADYASLDAGARKAAYDALKKDFGVKEPREWFDRVARSMAQPKGFRKEISLTVNSGKVSGVYCIFVPEDYDPLRPWPLLIGLHGGGPGGKDGKGVVGSGPDFYPFLDGNVKARGYITVCPTANAAPWAQPENDGLFTSLIQEMTILFNVDLNRVYLIGHSMGGYGTWHFGPKYAEKFASIAPASGGGHSSESKLADLGTGVYVYHSDDDPRCRVEPDREAAELLKKAKADFIYTELPNKDHSWPAEVVTDTFDFFGRHRLMVKAGKSVVAPHGARSSFLERMTVEEATFFPIASAGTGGNEVKAWLTDLSKGGGNGEKAAQKLVEKGDKTATPTLAAWLNDAKISEDVKVLCASTIGGLKDPKGVTALCAALSAESLKVRRAAAASLGQIGEAKGAAPLAAALDALGKYFDSRLQNGVMDIVDWEKLQDLNAVYLVALGKIGDPKTATVAGTVGIRKILLSKVSVDFDKQVQDGPEPTRRAAALAIVPALPGFKEAKLKADLGAIREAMAKDGEVLKACEDAEKGM